jgi:hypothetical protein
MPGYHNTEAHNILQTDREQFPQLLPEDFTAETAAEFVESIVLGADKMQLHDLCNLLHGIACSEPEHAKSLALHALRRAFTHHPHYDRYMYDLIGSPLLGDESDDN